MSYIGGALQGYETDPLSIGIAWTKAPDRAEEWTRIEENPVLGPTDADVRDFEKATLYKSQIIFDKSETLGHPFVMFYNGKEKTKHHTERIGMAVSMDMIALVALRRQAGHRQRQRNLRRSADREDRRSVGDVLFRLHLEAERV